MPASGDIRIRQVTESEANQFMTFLLEHYYREEPLTIGTAPPEPTAEDKKFLLSNIPKGNCFLAEEDQGNGSRIVGVVVGSPKDAAEPELMRRLAAHYAGSKWGRILDILSAVESGSDVCRRFGVPNRLHVHALAVNPELRGKAVGARLMQAMAQRARQLGYSLVSADCTSVYSAQLLRRLNYELVHTLRYADHLDASGQQVITPPPPHESVQTFVSFRAQELLSCSHETQPKDIVSIPFNLWHLRHTEKYKFLTETFRKLCHSDFVHQLKPNHTTNTSAILLKLVTERVFGERSCFW